MLAGPSLVKVISQYVERHVNHLPYLSVHSITVVTGIDNSIISCTKKLMFISLRLLEKQTSDQQLLEFHTLKYFLSANITCRGVQTLMEGCILKNIPIET